MVIGAPVLAACVKSIAAIRARGHTPGDDNEADALALLHWAIAQHDLEQEA